MRYGVYEKQYAIFPQRSGTLEIPDIMFRGEVTDSSSSYVFRNLNTRTITSYAEGHSITVSEKPADYPAEALWLPATEISIRETWDNDFSNVRVGDSVYRIIEIEAHGLDGAALPPLETPSITGVNLYPEPASIEHAFVEGNIVGKRIESTSMLMTADGTVVVPGINIPWYDIDTGEIKYATVENTAITVGAARSGSTGEALLLSNADLEEPTRETFAASAIPPEEQILVSSPTTPLWILSLAAALTALVFALSFVKFKRRAPAVAPRKEYPVAAPMYRRGIAPEAESQAFKEFINACSGKHLPALRLALIGWGRQYFADAELHTLDVLAVRSGNAEVSDICLRLQQSLYGQGSTQSSLDKDIQRLQTLLRLTSRLKRTPARAKTAAKPPTRRTPRSARPARSRTRTRMPAKARTAARLPTRRPKAPTSPPRPPRPRRPTPPERPGGWPPAGSYGSTMSGPPRGVRAGGRSQPKKRSTSSWRAIVSASPGPEELQRYREILAQIAAFKAGRAPSAAA
jgi:hypothetical protein